MVVLRGTDKDEYQKWARAVAGVRFNSSENQRKFMQLAYALPFWCELLSGPDFSELLTFTEQFDIVCVSGCMYEDFCKRYVATV